MSHASEKWMASLPAHALAYAVATIVVGAVVRLVFPFILPVRIVEGPLVQGADGDQATLIWYTNRHVHCDVRAGDSGAPLQRAEVDGTRHRIRLTGLPRDKDQRYEVLCESRVLHKAALKSVQPAATAFGFIVFGDSGRGSSEQYRLAQRMEELAGSDARVKFLLHTGDLVYGAGQRSDYRDRFFAPYRRLIDRLCFWPSLGNHDVSEPNPAQAYREVFELPENGPAGLTPEENYWFDFGSARIVVADTNLAEAELAARVAPWMASAFAAAPHAIRWRFAVFHHPPYTVGPHVKDESRPGIERVMVPAIQAAGVDIVFCGHDHLYQRTRPLWNGVPTGQEAVSSAPAPAAGERGAEGRGVVYIVSGAGGAKLYEAAPAASRPAYFEKVIDNIHSFTHVAIDGATLHLRQISVNGEILDDVTMSGR
ncbi:Alkaline phosphatase precursor [Phycisphaerae bacterium RAS1]|nr:Alkaline phosphatase precursor [Phycisphaerae bacterium RAS1]